MRSILRHFNELTIELKGFDIICVTETWLTSRANDRILHFPGLRQDRTSVPPNARPKKGGGILMYIKEELEAYVQPLKLYCGRTHYSEELWIKITQPGHKHLTIGTIYPIGKNRLFCKYFE